MKDGVTMTMWNPFRGCKKCSEGCKYCYIHKGDKRRNVDTSKIEKTKNFYKPIERNKNGEYKLKSGTVYTCFSTDFLIEEADTWRKECFEMMKERKDLNFLFLTKRIDRFEKVIPEDWGAGYENVTICCTIENQKNADYKLEIFSNLSIKHKCIVAQPLLEKINIEKYLDNIELVVVGGESDYNARELNYDWIIDIRKQCIKKNVNFEFRQCGTHFIKDGKKYIIKTRDLCRLAKKANINYYI
jgi:Bacteriophage protein gp37